MKFMLATILLMFSVPCYQEIMVKAGRTVAVEGGRLKIKFEAVVDDSRCPQGVDCIWSGNAEVVLKVTTTDGKSATVKLNTNLNPKEVDFHGYKIKLGRLSPYPIKDEKIEPSQYEAILIISKK